MLVVLLIPILVGAEWVEISQNHYRKDEPYKGTHSLEETTNTNVLYNNNSLLQHQWSKGYVHRVPNTGNVKRLQGMERTPAVKIERNPFLRDDLIVTENPERRFDTNKPKPTNSLTINDGNDNMDDGLHEQRQRVRPISNIDLGTRHGNKSSHRLVLKDRNKNDVIFPVNPEVPIRIVQTEIKKENIESFSKINVDKEKTSTVSNVYEKDIGKIDNNIKNDNNKQSTTKNKTKTSAMDVLVKLLKVVSQTISRSTQRSFNSKVRYLEDLKGVLLANIEDRINSVFPDDDTVHQRRRRAEGTEPRGHVEFPSSESSLMTISFLTFAVFLIKLVLQVIHTYKAKTMMVTPAVVATVGRATAAIFNKPLHPARN